MKSVAYEQALTKQGVNFIYMERLDLDAVDAQAGLRNQARLDEPIVTELVDQYTQWYKEGSEAPPLVVYEKKRAGKRSWVPIDGNQRLKSAKDAGVRTHDAYVVQTTDPMIIDRLTWNFNNLVNGKRLSQAECLEHAKTMVNKYKMDIKAAAKEYNIKEWILTKAVRADRMRNILRERHADQACALTDDKLDELSPIAQIGDDVFVAAATTAHRCGLTVDDIGIMKKDMAKAKTAEEKVGSIVKFGESDLAQMRRAETKGGTVKPSKNLLPNEQMWRQLKGMHSLIERYHPASLRRSGNNYRDMHELAIEVVDGLVQIFGLGARPTSKKKQEVS